MRDTDEWLSVTEAAPVLGMSPSGVRDKIRNGVITAIQHAEGGKYRIRRSECDRYLADLESGALTAA